MLSRHVQAEFLAEIEKQLSRLQSYRPHTHAYFLEARLALMHLKEIIESKPLHLEVELQAFFSTRWSILQNTDAQYLHDFENPANQASIAIARTLGKILKIHYFYILMSSLKAHSEEEYVISPFTEDCNLREFILSSDNTQLIHVRDTLDFAQQDAVLKYNCIPPDGKAKALNVLEERRLLSRHPSFQQAFDAISLFVSFKFNAMTVGAALNRLIEGLNGGGVHSKNEDRGEEFDAGKPATLAIFEFSQYLKSLEPTVKERLMDAYKEDRFESGKVEKKTIRREWSLLSRQHNKNHNKTYRGYRYCVEIIAGHIQEILDENPFLFDLCSEKSGHLDQYVGLEQAQIQAMSELTGSVDEIRQHRAYGEKADKEFSHRVLQILHDKMSFFSLQDQDVQFILQMYSASTISPDDKNLVCVCKSLLHHTRINSPALIRSALKRASAQVKEAFLKNFPQVSVARTSFTLLAKSSSKAAKRKNEEDHEEIGLGENRRVV